MTASSHRHTADACRWAADIWANDGSKPHADFAPVLRSWAARSEARALEAEWGEQPDLFTETRHV